MKLNIYNKYIIEQISSLNQVCCILHCSANQINNRQKTGTCLSLFYFYSFFYMMLLQLKTAFAAKPQSKAGEHP